MIIGGHYNPLLVIVSVVLAVTAAYAALDLSGRVRQSGGAARAAWIATAAVAMGSGIWAMHFVAMLAYVMPMEMSYDLGQTLASLFLPIAVTGLAFAAVAYGGPRRPVILASGILMGIGIAAMHYMGMRAMRMAATVTYDMPLVALSVAIAIVASTVALWLAFTRMSPARRIVAACLMGLAIAGMHYTGMAAATFHHDMANGMNAAGYPLDATGLAAAIASVAFVILFLSLAAAGVDRRLAGAAAREAEALRASEERFRTLYRRTPLPLHALNEHGEIDYVSDVWLELLGYTREEVLGRPLTDFMTEASARQRVEVDWPALLENHDLRSVEYQFVTKDGRKLDCLLSAHIERDEKGRIVQGLCGLVDITERRKAEERLRQAQKLEAIGQLTGGLAHDFNNLLAVVLSNLHLLRKRLPADPALNQLLDTATRGAERGAALTQRLLAFSRRQELRPQDVDIPALVGSMAELLSRSIGPEIAVETRFPLSLPKVRVDANQLELALINLAVNARDAMPDGGRIVIAAEAIDAPADPESDGAGRSVCLSVTDTGTGMDEQTLAAATDPFFTTKGIGKGTGLGLSMVHGLAAQSGGRLVLKSRPGEGTRAEIHLPQAEAQAGAQVETGFLALMPTVERSAAPAGDGSPTEPVPARLGSATPERTAEPATTAPTSPTDTAGKAPARLRILAVDDDPLVLMGTVGMLEDLGHEVFEAGSGAEALALLQTREVDVIVTDQAMPKMTGTELIAAVRATIPAMPVVLASGYTESPNGLDPTVPRLSKPFPEDKLAAAIATAIDMAAGTSRVELQSGMPADTDHNGDIAAAG